MGGFLYPDCGNGPGEGDIVLANQGWDSPRIFTASDISMSRGVNEHGTLSFDLRTEDMIGYVAQADRLRRKWVRWTDPYLGPWIGQVVDANPDPQTGVIDCRAQGFSWRFKRRLVPKASRLLSGTPGALITQTLKLVARDEALPIEGIDADEIGDPITYELRGQTLDAIIRAVQARSNQEWYIDPTDQRMKWRTTYGSDLRHSVQLVDGLSIASYSPYFSLEGVTNAMLAQPDDDQYTTAQAYWFERPESIEEYGRLEESSSYTGAVTRSTLQPIARRDLERRSRRGRTITIQAVNEGGVFSLFGPGDTISVVMSRINQTVAFRCMVQSYKVDSRILTCTGFVV